MALESDLMKTLTLSWRTDKPFKDACRTSSDFKMIGTTWYLKMESDVCLAGNPNPNYTLSLIEKESESRKVPFAVSPFVEINMPGNYFPIFCGSRSTVQSNQQTVWSYPMRLVSTSVLDFKDCAKWNVICIFHDVAPSMCQVKNETKHLSTQTDMVEPSTTLHGESSCELENLCVDFSNLLDEESFADLELECEGHSFLVHKSILAARSDVLASKFKEDLDDPECVDFTEMDSKVLELFLKYVYSGKIPNLTVESAPGFYAAGRKYALRGFQKYFSEWMVRNLSEENCLGFLTVSDEHGDEALKNAVVSFIVSHPQTLKTKDWDKFSQKHLKLAVEVYKNFVSSAEDQKLPQ